MPDYAYCECPCEQTIPYGRRFAPGHAQAHAANLRRAALSGNHYAVEELYRRGWALKPMADTTPPSFGFEAEFWGMDRDDAVDVLRSVGLKAADEGYHHNASPNWRVTDDASVSHEGNELVSPILRMQKMHHDNSALAVKALRDNGGRVDASCGLHVHHSVAGKSVSDLAQMAGYYALFQPLIDRFLPSSRRSPGNTYARTMHDASHWHAAILRQGKTLRELRENVGGAWGRYHSVNVQSLYNHGTIEFRQHAGTLNGMKIRAWTELTRAFMDVSDNHESVLELILKYGNEDSVRSEMGTAGMLDFLGLRKRTKEFLLKRESDLNNHSDTEDAEANSNPVMCEGCGCDIDSCECGSESDCDCSCEDCRAGYCDCY